MLDRAGVKGWECIYLALAKTCQQFFALLSTTGLDVSFSTRPHPLHPTHYRCPPLTLNTRVLETGSKPCFLYMTWVKSEES